MKSSQIYERLAQLAEEAYADDSPALGEFYDDLAALMEGREEMCQDALMDLLSEAS